MQQQHLRPHNRRRHHPQPGIHHQHRSLRLIQPRQRGQRTRQHRARQVPRRQHHRLIFLQHILRHRHRQQLHRVLPGRHHLVAHHRLIRIERKQLLQPKSNHRQRLSRLRRQLIEVHKQHPHRRIRHNHRHIAQPLPPASGDVIQHPPHRGNHRRPVGNIANLQSRRHRAFHQIGPGHGRQQSSRILSPSRDYTLRANLNSQPRPRPQCLR